MGGRELGLVGAVMQGAEGQISRRHIAIPVSAEQALAPPFPAIIDLHDVRGRLLVPVAVCHMHIVADQFDARKDPIQRNIPRAAFVFQMEAAVTTIC